MSDVIATSKGIWVLKFLCSKPLYFKNPCISKKVYWPVPSPNYGMVVLIPQSFIKQNNQNSSPKKVTNVKTQGKIYIKTQRFGTFIY